jgi:hypothetical protein
MDTRPTTDAPGDRGLGEAPGSEAGANAAGRFDFRAFHQQVADLAGKQVFLVGGAAKSGTTWVQALLDGHPRVSCTGENHFVNSLRPKLRMCLEDYNRSLLDQRGNTAYQLGKAPALIEREEFWYVYVCAMLAILLKQARGKSVLAVGDKTTVNVRAFGEIASLIPGSKLIHVARDPRDAVLSGWHHVRRLFPEPARSHFPTLVDYARHYADTWVDEVGHGVAFGAGNPDRYLELRYEDLVERTGPTLAPAFRFLGVDDDDEVVQECVQQASFETLSGGRGRGQEDPSSFFRKGIVGEWKTGLDPESTAYVVAKCRDLMTHFGYL